MLSFVGRRLFDIEVPAEFSEQIEGFRRAFLVRVLALLAASAWAAGMAVLFFKMSTTAVLVLFGFEGLCWLSYRLSIANRLRLAQYVIALGVNMWALGIIWLVPEPILLFLPALAAVFGVAILDVTPAAIYAALLFVGQLVSAVVLFNDSWLQWQILLAPFLTVVAASLALMWGANLYTILGWAVHSTRTAVERLEEVQEHRAQLRQSMEDLDAVVRRLERANEMLTTARAEAEEAHHARNQFALTVSHELRTPLHFIIGFSELMVNSPSTYAPRRDWPPGLYDDIHEIYNNSNHLMRLVNDILELGQAEARQMVLTKEWVRPDQIVREAEAIMHAAIGARSLQFHIEMEPDLPELFVDRTRIRQVLINLIGNSLRFTEEGSITVSARKRATEVLFSVQDTGVGIPADEIPKVFQEFGQADATVWRRRGGSGLGVPISRRFVGMHGGHMWLESEVGKGTDFFFTLPMPGASVKLAPMYFDGAAENAWQYRPTQRDAEKIVLVLSPDPSAAQLIQGYMDGYGVAAAVDASLAAQMVSDLLPHALIVDQSIAGESDVTSLIRNLPYDLPVVVLSLPGSPAQSRQLPPGVFRHLIKPVRREDLTAAIYGLPVDVRLLLVVDDDPGMSRFVSLALAAADGPTVAATRHIQVLPASTGQAALEHLRQTKTNAGGAPDAVLLDLTLPDMSGWDVLESMQKNPEWRQIPVILLTAAELPQEMDFRERQVLHVSMNRPLTSERLGRALQSLLGSLQPSSPAGANSSGQREDPSA
jgi:signal transduction histidine kinase/CheY-like chemotaxis protein